MAKRRLRQTDIMIYARVTKRDGTREQTVLPFQLKTVNLSMSFVVWIVAGIAALFTTADRIITAVYELFFTGWREEWPVIWLAIKLLFVKGDDGTIWETA